MKIQTAQLKSALDNIRPIVGRKTSLPILSCVKLHAENNRLNITASNIDEFIIESVDCEGDIAPTCVSFNHLAMAISGKEAELESASSTLLVKCGRNETEIATLDAEEFPPNPKFDKPQNHAVDCDELAKSVQDRLPEIYREN
ncbi:MAG: hypothetical protein WCL30_06670, partial [Pseudomonadota bacterium]